MIQPEGESVGWKMITTFNCLEHMWNQSQAGIFCTVCGAKGVIRIEREIITPGGE